MYDYYCIYLFLLLWCTFNAAAPLVLTPFVRDQLTITVTITIISTTAITIFTMNILILLLLSLYLLCLLNVLVKPIVLI